MNILIFDTETISVGKPFCYNLGYTIFDTDTKQNLVSKDFVIKQIWENKALFTTAYYENKKSIYVANLRSRKAKIVNYGVAMAQMIKDIETYNVANAFAYNSNFDIGVFDFNCEWYKCRNALDYVETFDIWGFTSELIAKGLANQYVAFAEKYGFLSECGNLKNNADTWGKFIYNNLEWEEEHTALSDSLIECEILDYCLQFLPLKHYKVNKCIASKVAPKKTLTIETPNQTYSFTYSNKREYKTKGLIVLSE